MRAPSDPYEDDEDMWASRGSLAIPYLKGETDRLEDDDIWAMDPATIGPRGGGAQAPGEADASFDKIYRVCISSLAQHGRNDSHHAFRRTSCCGGPASKVATTLAGVWRRMRSAKCLRISTRYTPLYTLLVTALTAWRVRERR